MKNTIYVQKTIRIELDTYNDLLKIQTRKQKKIKRGVRKVSEAGLMQDAIAEYVQREARK